MKIEEVDRKILLKHLSRHNANWIGREYGREHPKTFFATLNKNEVKKLYVYHHDSGTRKIPFRGIYRPLGISFTEYSAKYFTLENVVRRLEHVHTNLFSDGRLKWYAKMSVYYRRKINMEKNPAIIRPVGKGHYEVIDGNRRLIAKALREGFTFSCSAYVIIRK